MEVRVLGPVEAGPPDDPSHLGGPRPQTIVAALAVAAGPVSADRLIEEVWRDDPPPSATGTLQSYLSRLRRVLGPERLVGRPAGYQLRFEAGHLDVEVFEADLRRARTARDLGDRVAAVSSYEAALSRWRGEVAEGLDHGPTIREAAVRLHEQRLSAIEERLEVLLAAERHHEITGELEALTVAHPHRERLHAQRLIALYRSGRQAEALDAYRQAREALIAAVGIEPGPQLRELHRRILDQDPALGLHAATVPDAAVVGAASARTSTSPEPSVSAPAVPEGSRTNLPAAVGSFVGRTAARRDIAARLAGDVRLLTLVGAGGCGKTQLALRAAGDIAASYPDGVWWVELAAHRGPERVASAVADAIGVATPPGADPLRQISARLRDGRHLLILDNCEHLVDACADLTAELLRRCSDLRILATSREPLDVDGEQVSRVASLGLPAEDARPDEVLEAEAARLLVLRGQASRPDLQVGPEDGQAVARICRALDGIPLALELAAARLNVLSLEELAGRLDHHLAVLGSGRRTAPARHRTLEAAIGWSYDLLDDAERRLLAALTVFRGGCTVADAELVCGEEGANENDVVARLAALVDKSLIQSSTAPDGRARLDLLVTVRSFARSRLEAGAAVRLRARHAEHYTAIAEEAAPRLTGPEQVRWLNRLHADQDNLRAVLEGADGRSARVAAAVWWFWLQFGHVVEGDRWVRVCLDTPLDLPPEEATTVHRALQRGAARLAMAVDEPGRALQHLEVAIGSAGEASAPAALAGMAADEALRARLQAEADETGKAATSLDQARAMAHAAADPWASAAVEQQAAIVALRQQDLVAATRASAAAEAGFHEAGDRWSACLARLDAARIARARGDLAATVDLHRSNLTRGLELTVSSLDFVGLPQDLQGLATLALEVDRPRLAARLLGATASLRASVELPGATTERYSALVETTQGILGEETFEQDFASGRAGSAERSVAQALESAEELRLVVQGSELSTAAK